MQAFAYLKEDENYPMVKLSLHAGELTEELVRIGMDISYRPPKVYETLKQLIKGKLHNIAYLKCSEKFRHL